MTPTGLRCLGTFDTEYECIVLFFLFFFVALTHECWCDFKQQKQIFLLHEAACIRDREMGYSVIIV